MNRDAEFKRINNRIALKDTLFDVKQWIRTHMRNPTYKDDKGFSIKNNTIRISAGYMYGKWEHYSLKSKFDLRYYVRLLRLLS